jgi:acyl-CoA thioester hydrolase
VTEQHTAPFSVSVTVRGYETDALGHLNQSVYLQYAEHARWCALEAAGSGQSELLARGGGAGGAGDDDPLSAGAAGR